MPTGAWQGREWATRGALVWLLPCQHTPKPCKLSTALPSPLTPRRLPLLPPTPVHAPGRQMNGPVHEVQRGGGGGGARGPVRECGVWQSMALCSLMERRDSCRHLGGCLLPTPVHPPAGLLLGRADNGMCWLWDLSERLGWADGSHGGSWLRQAASGGGLAAPPGAAADAAAAAAGEPDWEMSEGSGEGSGDEQQQQQQQQQRGYLEGDECYQGPLLLGCIAAPYEVWCSHVGKWRWPACCLPACRLLCCCCWCAALSPLGPHRDRPTRPCPLLLQMKRHAWAGSPPPQPGWHTTSCWRWVAWRLRTSCGTSQQIVARPAPTPATPWWWQASSRGRPGGSTSGDWVPCLCAWLNA